MNSRQNTNSKVKIASWEFPKRNRKELAADDKAEICRSSATSELQHFFSNELFHLVHRGSAHEHQQHPFDSLAFEMPSIQVLEFVTEIDGAKSLLINDENVEQLSAGESKTSER
jgi:hypothetical protein